MNKAILIATIRKGRRLIARRFAIVDMTYLDEDEVIEIAEHELRSDIQFTYCRINFDLLSLVTLENLLI